MSILPGAPANPIPAARHTRSSDVRSRMGIAGLCMVGRRPDEPEKLICGRTASGMSVVGASDTLHDGAASASMAPRAARAVSARARSGRLRAQRTATHR